MKVCIIENRGQRSHVIGIADHISGGEVRKGADDKPVNVYINPGKIVTVSELCAEKLAKGWSDEIKILRRTDRKD